MYQHHIQVKTQEPLTSDEALAWYSIVKEYGPENIVYPYQYNGHSIAMEYGVATGEELMHCYTVPLTRDLTEDETQFILMAWEYVYPADFDVEISNQYSTDGDYDIDVDADVAKAAIADMKKWHHNRWVSEMISDGWRAGNYFSESNKTHPALRDWDSLPDSHRRSPEFSNKEIVEWLRKHRI